MFGECRTARVSLHSPDKKKEKNTNGSKKEKQQHRNEKIRVLGVNFVKYVCSSHKKRKLESPMRGVITGVYWTFPFIICWQSNSHVWPKLKWNRSMEMIQAIFKILLLLNIGLFPDKKHIGVWLQFHPSQPRLITSYIFEVGVYTALAVNIGVLL